MACLAAFGLFVQMQVGQNPNPGGGAALAGMFFFLMVCMAIALLPTICTLAGMWAVFAKAGEPGWAAIVPIYNFIVLLRIAGMPGWYVVLVFIPCIGAIAAIAFSIMIAIKLAERFNVGGGFVIGLILLPYIFYPILGFGSAECDGGDSRPKRRKIKRVSGPEDEEDDVPPPPPPRVKRRRVADDDDEDNDDRDDDEERVEEQAQTFKRKVPAPPPSPTGGAKLTCPECGVSLRLPPDLPPGKRIRCPKCQTAFTTPG